MTSRQLLNVGGESFRIGTWHADDTTAYRALRPKAGEPSIDGLRNCLRHLAESGYSSVITSALHPEETRSFTATGFEEFDRLNVLAHDLSDLDALPAGPPVGIRLRRARRRDREGALAVDGRAFPELWRLDRDAMADAERATPSRRFRVAVGTGPTDQRGTDPGSPEPGSPGPASTDSRLADGRVLGYAITGRGGGQGFLQRLATDPAAAGRGIATALVLDALRWALRHGCRRVLVNTQRTNDRALELYLRLGFQATPTDLVVLRRHVP